MNETAEDTEDQFGIYPEPTPSAMAQLEELEGLLRSLETRAFSSAIPRGIEEEG